MFECEICDAVLQESEGVLIEDYAWDEALEDEVCYDYFMCHDCNNIGR